MSGERCVVSGEQAVSGARCAVHKLRFRYYSIAPAPSVACALLSPHRSPQSPRADGPYSSALVSLLARSATPRVCDWTLRMSDLIYRARHRGHRGESNGSESRSAREGARGCGAPEWGCGAPEWGCGAPEWGCGGPEWGCGGPEWGCDRLQRRLAGRRW